MKVSRKCLKKCVGVLAGWGQKGTGEKGGVLIRDENTLGGQKKGLADQAGGAGGVRRRM